MKRLLFAMLCIVSALGMRAQTTLTGVGSITSGEQYYIVNDATGLFLTPGNDYGTRATLDQSSCGPATVTLADGKYTIKWSYGNGLFVNADDGSSLYCDMNNQGNNYWTITSNGDNTFSLQLASDQARYNADSYLTAASNVVFANVQYNASNENLRKWRFISASALRESMPSSSSKMDVSIFVHGAQCMISGNNLGNFKKMYPWTTSGNDWKGQNNADPTGFSKPWLECWNGSALTSRSAKNTISNLPAGSYTLSAYAIGGNGVTFYAKVGDGEKITAETGNGSPILSTINFDIETESANVEFGIESTAESTSGWIAIDNVKLEYISFSAFRDVYETALQNAQDASEALDGFSVYASQKSSLDGVISSNTLTGDDLNSRSALTAATTALNNATAAVSAQVAACKQYAAIASAIGGGTNVDLTSYVVNAGFEQGNLNGWTSVNGGGVANNNNFSQKVGTYYTERWQANGESQVKLSDGTLTHDPIVLPAGLYQISATGQVQEQKNGVTGGGYFLYANSEKVEIGAPARYSTYVIVEDKAELVIKFALEGCTGNWISCDDVQLTYAGSDFPAYTLADGKMNADVAAAQTAAETTFTSNKTVDNYNALLTAIAAAEASIKAYAPMTAAVDKIDAALAAATSATESTDAYNTVKAAYTDATIADADIMTQVAAAYDAVIPVIKSQTAANADFTLAIQNHSFEYGNMTGWTAAASSDTGVRETSNATYAATGSDGSYLFNTWWQGVPLTQALEGLPTGEYTLTASVASDGATIYLLANGEHNEGTETAGEYPTKDTFQDATITFLVKDGKATIGVVGGADGEAGVHKDYVEAGYWWYKADNFRLVKNRELTEEELAVIPTAIALDETEVTLTADAPTKTFELTFTPEDATNTVTWTSSDESVATVADGVVTAISSGTATITVTSTLDATVTASATVTVSFPETEVATEDVVVDGPAISTVTYGPNLIKNGTFEYPDGYYGWTDATAGAAQLSSSNFDIVTEGENKYLKSKNHGGSTAASSIGTSWPIEAGKTYVFGYKAKAVNAGTTEFHVVSLTNNLTTETSKISTKQTVGTDWTDIKYKFTNTDGYAYLQFRARWLGEKGQLSSFDDFYLVEVTSESTVGNVEYATAAIPTANIGTGAFQYSQDAVDAANALVQGTATVAEVEAAYAALTTVNAPAEGQLFNVVLTYDGWTYDNKAMTYIANGRTDGGNYNIQYKEVANQNLAQAFTFTKVEGSNYKMSQIDADGVARYISTGVPYSGNTSQIRTTTNADQALVVTVIPTSTEGVWNLKNTEANNYIGSQDAGVYTVNSHIDFVLAETQKPSITINTTAAGWGTTMLPFAVASVPEGVKVYSCAKAEGATLTLEEVETLEANKPYIIEGAWEATLTGDAQGTQLQYTEGMLTGTYAKMAAPNGCYILQKQGEKVGFFKVDTSVNQPNVGANRAYLTAPAGSEIKAFDLGGDTDGINSLVNDLQKGDIYDLAGRKVQRMQKGNVYIVNGKKVVVK